MKVQSVLVDLATEKEVTTQIKSFYKKVKGVFITGLTDNLALIEIRIGNENIVADGKFPAKIIATTDSLSWRDVAFELDKDVNNDIVNISVETSSTDKIFVNFIVE